MKSENNTQKRYQAGRFVIRSLIELALPVAIGVDDSNDFRLIKHPGHIGLIHEKHLAKGNGIYTSSNSVLIRNVRVGDIEVFDNGEIQFVESPKYEKSVFDQFIAGPIIAAMAARRGLTVIHASCVSFKDRAAIIVGKSGAGKSTLASYLSSEGWRLVSDDLAIINIENDVAMVWPTAVTSWLYKDSFDVIMKSVNTPRTIRGDGKISMLAPAFSEFKPSVIHSVIFPEFGGELDGVSITGVPNKTARDVILGQLCGMAMISEEKTVQNHRLLIDELVMRCNVVQLRRPKLFNALSTTRVALENLLSD